MDTHNDDARIIRIVRYVMPASSEEEFLRSLAETNAIFSGVEGCLQYRALKQQGGSGESTFTTIGEWSSRAAIERARQAIMARHEQMKQDPQDMFDRLKISAAIEDYVDASLPSIEQIVTHPTSPGAVQDRLSRT